jgi:hypothetical protein
VEQAFAWIGYLAEWFGQFFPRRHVVMTTHGWIKFVAGFGRDMRVVSGGPGAVWHWPLTTEFTDYPVVRQTTPLPSQILTTSDDRTIAVSEMPV